VFTHRYSAAVWLAIYVALQIGANFVSPPVRSPAAFVALVLLSTALFIFLALAVCASLAYAVRRPAPAAVLLVVGAVGLTSFGTKQPAGLVLSTTRGIYLVIAAVGLGILLASAIRERNILLPAAVFAAFADYFMVHSPHGTVRMALNNGAAGQKLINAMSAHVPSFHGHFPVLTVGMADFVFLALFFACVYRFELNFKATFAAFFALLTLSLFLVSIVGPIPALAPMALGFVTVNFRRFNLSRSELQAMGAAAAIVLVVALVILRVGRS
jgi:hypothetical protein